MRKETIEAVLKSKGIDDEKLADALQLLFDQPEFKNEIAKYVVHYINQEKKKNAMIKGKIGRVKSVTEF